MEGQEEELLTVEELAVVLKVPKSWVHSKTRKGQTAIPFLKVGRHLRFQKRKVLEFFAKSQPHV